MAWNGISTKRQAPVEASRGPALMLNRCTAILVMALFASMLGGPTSAAERGTAEQRRACTLDVFKFCGEFIPDADRITVCLWRKVRDLSPECRIVMAGERKG